jgi:hypothetical protein
MSVTITNKKICDFFQKYPNINLENILCSFIDLIEKFAGNYSNISEERIIESIGTIKSTINDVNTSNLDNYKSILKLNSYENKDDINKVLSTITNKNSELFFKNKDETYKLVSDLISKNNDLISKDNEIAFQKMKNILPQDLIDAMKEYFTKNKTSAFKGQQSETKIENLLNNIFQDGEITNMAKTNHSGDFHLRRENKDMVMIENKDYKANVGFDSVEKFRNDCKDLNMHGVIISHHSGIATKRDYSVEIFDNKVLVYLTNVEYDACKILTAVNLIDNLSTQLNKICNTNNSDNISIDQDTMLDINEELTNFIQQKEKLYKSINRTTTDLKEAADGLKLPKLTTFFTGKCDAFQAYKCQWCNKIFPSRTSLGSHTKGCKGRPKETKDNKKTPRKTKQTNETEMSIDTCIVADD